MVYSGSHSSLSLVRFRQFPLQLHPGCASSACNKIYSVYSRIHSPLSLRFRQFPPRLHPGCQPSVQQDLSGLIRDSQLPVSCTVPAVPSATAPGMPPRRAAGFIGFTPGFITPCLFYGSGSSLRNCTRDASPACTKIYPVYSGIPSSPVSCAIPTIPRTTR